MRVVLQFNIDSDDIEVIKAGMKTTRHPTREEIKLWIEHRVNEILAGEVFDRQFIKLLDVNGDADKQLDAFEDALRGD